MECPSCGKNSPEGSTQCVYCEAELGQLQRAARLRKELSRARTEMERALERFANLELEVQQWDAEVRESLMSDGAATSGPRLRQVPRFQAAPGAPRDKRALELRFGQHWMLITGIIVLLAGIAYFVTQSSEQSWATPLARLLQAGLLALIALAGGEYIHRRKFAGFGLYLMGGAIGVWYLAIFAASRIYGLIPQIPALILIGLVTGVAVMLALLHDVQWLAVLGLIGGCATALVLSTGAANQVELLSYVTIASGGALALACYKRWEPLIEFGFVTAWLVFAAWYATAYAWRETEAIAAVLISAGFIQLLFLAFTVVPLIYYLKALDPAQAMRRLAVPLSSPLVALAFSYPTLTAAMPPMFVGIVALVYAGVSSYQAWALFFPRPAARHLFVLPFASSVAFLALSISLLFAGEWITICWMAAAVGVFWLTRHAHDGPVYASAWLLMFLGILRFLFMDAGPLWTGLLAPPELKLSADFLAGQPLRLLTELSLLASLWLGWRLVTPPPAKLITPGNPDRTALIVMFLVVLFLILNIEVGTFFQNYVTRARFAAISVLWSLFSTFLLVLGFIWRRVSLRRAGILLFAVTAIKVVSSDMQEASTSFRIVSFFILGALLITASYLYYLYGSRIGTGATTDTTAAQSGRAEGGS